MERFVRTLAVTALVTITTLTTVECSCPSGLDLDWREYNGSCYWLSTDKKSWQQARKACQTEQPTSDLAWILDLEENSFITETFSRQDGWIGLNDIDNEGQFTWSHGDAVDFLYWADGQPDNLWLNQDCVHIDYDTQTGQWDDEHCSEEKHFVCKLDIAA